MSTHAATTWLVAAIAIGGLGCGGSGAANTGSGAGGSGGVAANAGGSSPTGGADGSTGGGATGGATPGSGGSATGGGGGVAAPARAIGAYENASCTCQPDNQGGPEVDAFGTWLGATVDIGEDFLPTDGTWDAWAAPDWNLSGWKAWKAKDSKHQLVLGPSFGPTTDLAAGAAGMYDADWKNLGQRLADAGLGDTTFRIAHEFNGNWYWYTPAGREQDFIGYWKHAVTALRSAEGQKFKFFWNPSLGVSTQNGAPFHAEDAYPGDDVVDYIGPDVYDSDYGAYPTSGTITQAMQDAAWNNMKTGDHGLDWFKSFAAQHHKPLAIGEWGVWEVGDHHGGGDDPSYIQHIHDWVSENDVAFQIYFNVTASDGDHQIWPTTQFPMAAARYQSVFH